MGCAAEDAAKPTPALNPNAPVLNAIGNKSVTADNNINFTVTASDPNGESLTYTTDGTVGSGNPYVGSNRATFNMSSNQIFNWTPTTNEVGTYNVEFTVENQSGETDSEQITITVTSASSSTGQTLFNTHCGSCHGVGGSAFVLGPATEAQITEAIDGNFGGMGSLSFLTTAQRQAIEVYLATL